MLEKFTGVVLLLFLLILAGCKKQDDAFFIEVPAHFPEMPIPRPTIPTAEKIALGKRLFFDSRLSLDSTLNCSSCHLPKFAFSDTLAVSLGINGVKGKRNAPSLLNAGYERLFNKDGGVTKLDIFAMLPIEDHSEMGIPIWKLVERLSTDNELQRQSNKAFDRDIDPYVITRALATYVRTLVSGTSKYDQFLLGEIQLSDAEESGRKIFFSSEAQCSTCHEGVLFTNHQFRNNGTKLFYNDQGRKLVTGKEEDRGLFKVPSLRNVAITAPYMHDGSFKDLEIVIDHYKLGGFQHFNQSPLIKPLNLSSKDKSDLIAFLHTLTDDSFLVN